MVIRPRHGAAGVAMTARNGGSVRLGPPVPWLLPPSWQLLWGVAGFVYKLTLWAGGGWYPRPLPHSEAPLPLALSIARKAASSLDGLDDYTSGYKVAAASAANHSLAEIRAGLHRFLSSARAEFQWGMINALADELRTRNDANVGRPDVQPER